jgi:transposase-like protein
MRKRSKEENRQIVDESLESGVTVVNVAGKYGVRPGQVFEWRRAYKEGRLTAEPNVPALLSARLSNVSRSPTAGAIYVSLSNARIEITGFADSMAGKRSLCRTLLNRKSRQGDWDRRFSVTERNGRYCGHGEPTVFAANA